MSSGDCGPRSPSACALGTATARYGGAFASPAAGAPEQTRAGGFVRQVLRDSQIANAHKGTWQHMAERSVVELHRGAGHRVDDNPRGQESLQRKRHGVRHRTRAIGIAGSRRMVYLRALPPGGDPIGFRQRVNVERETAKVVAPSAQNYVTVEGGFSSPEPFLGDGVSG